MLFIIDLPRLSVPAKKESQDMPFAVELARFLKAQGHTDDLVDSLNKYDFSRTAPYGFVHTMLVNVLDRGRGLCVLLQLTRGSEQAPIPITSGT
jgi:hypothetical protein